MRARLVLIAASILAVSLSACASSGDAAGSADDEVKSAGTAAPREEGGLCGGIAGLTCNAGLECRRGASHPDASGTCVRKTARAGESCEGRGGRTCAAELFCIFDEAAQCGATDEPGKCVDARTLRCAQDFDPVCGCDGKTYANGCMAVVEGASVKRKGACAGAGTGANAGESCGVRGGPECKSGLFCIFDQAAQCGAADKPGKCFDGSTLRCAQNFDPVCGCDGKTYSNTCMASVQGASVKSEGACP